MSPMTTPTSNRGRSHIARKVVVSVVGITFVLGLAMFLVWLSLSRYFEPLKIRHWERDCIFASGIVGRGNASFIEIGRPDRPYVDSPEFEIRFDIHDIVLRFPNPDLDLLNAPPWSRSPSRLPEWSSFDFDVIGTREGVGFVVRDNIPVQIRISDVNPSPIPISIRSLPDGKWYKFPLSFDDLTALFGPPDSDHSFLSI